MGNTPEIDEYPLAEMYFPRRKSLSTLLLVPPRLSPFDRQSPQHREMVDETYILFDPQGTAYPTEVD
jgi:hypothetical protein